MTATRGRLDEVGYRFPTVTDDERRAYRGLSALLERLPEGDVHGDGVALVPRSPEGSRPVTTFTPTEGGAHLRLDGVGVERRFEGFALLDEGANAPEYAPGDLGGQLREDDVGPYVEFGGTPSAGLELPELARRLGDHVLGMDHTGVDLPAANTDERAWEELVDGVAAASALYRYPTGEPWYFALSTTDAEFEEGVDRFPADRTPRFELVRANHGPVLQFAVRTDLARSEAETLLPEPYGVSFPGVDEFFRSVRVAHPWSAVGIRFDCYFRDTADDWTTGEWLVTEGGRIHPA